MLRREMCFFIVVDNKRAAKHKKLFIFRGKNEHESSELFGP